MKTKDTIINILRPCSLTTLEVDSWQKIVDKNPQFDNPFFSPLFTLAVSKGRKDIYIAKFSKLERTVGYLPFHKRELAIGKPIGGILSDFQGIIVDQNIRLDLTKILTKCRLSIFDFDHLIVNNLPESCIIEEYCSSPYIDISSGIEAYIRERQESGTKQINQLLRKKRKFEREIGKLKFVPDDQNPQALRFLLNWKSDQYNCTGAPDIFQYSWVTNVVNSVLKTKTKNFSGLLSSLYCNDNLVAVHMGMKTQSVWHWWFPTYNKMYSKYSPGLVLLLEMLNYAPQIGINRIDLGKGNERYKYSLANGFIRMAVGSAQNKSTASFIRMVDRTVQSYAELLPLGKLSQAPRKFSNRIDQYLIRRF